MTESTYREPNVSQSRSHSPQASTSSIPGGTGTNPPNQSRTTSTIRSTETHTFQADTNSDKATAAFIRRVLCSHNVLLGNGEKAGNTPRPIEDVLPPLTSSNEIDLQLYGIISVIIKEFVQTWYSKITPDHVFVNEVVQIIAHCTRAFEQRLRKVDLEALLLDEIPERLEAHLTSFRLANQHVSSTNSLVSNPRLIYHTLHPHPALSPVPTELVPSTVVEQRENESAWRQLLIQGVLVLLLPTEDLENGCLRSLVAEIFAEMILGNGISGKACEGWTLWEGITKIAESLQAVGAKEKDPPSADVNPEPSLTRLERYGLLSLPIEKGSEPKQPLVDSKRHHETIATVISGLFWAMLQYTLLACTAMRVVALTVAAPSSLPSRAIVSEQSSESTHQSQIPQVDALGLRRPLGVKRPIVSMRLWSCAAQFVELDIRMPWLLGFISMLRLGTLVGPGKVGDTDGVLDRYLSHAIHTHVLNPASLPDILRTVRSTLFPNNTMGPSRQTPSEEEAKEIKRNCAAALLDIVPLKVAAAFFATTSHDAQFRQVEETLDCFDDAYLNKHLIFQIVELIVIRLFPELGEQGVRELMEERIE
ncbi:hypothetical protein P153DRAFT_298998 [Dothidotthia symphoricarpi CBS 119687]|uniref:PXA domain-containing protein n=1 Tax=Dothidotthia symphoricarpi CBS 119687 TaxID=1392245 RepID=A0A6A6A195_9PLEO|nr:uncharacterized protein P153DRAFT_298998 [Dothidotthia symphoricarpi CBS 119687]KAF2125772.1 hypothetical protein P153DRAFT_298998 [Dothidotthia symphoricarpi CBS 119687]